MKIWATAAVVALTLTSAPAEAWNARGHMVTAALAWEQMTPAARARASALLRLNPQYDDWVSGVSAANRDKVAFIVAATWPDRIRGLKCDSRTPPPCYRDEGYTPPDASADLNIGYADMRLRRYWHFKDLAFSPDGTETKEAFAHNAETQIVMFEAALGDASLADEAKSFDLAWLLHLVGDVHQPLHAVSRFTNATPNGDNGGGLVKICLPQAANCNTRQSSALHSFWDGAIGTSESPASAITKAASMPHITFGEAVLDSMPSVWIAESFELARIVTYADPIGPGRGPYRLTDQYRARAGSTAEHRIILGGARLARMLNRRLG
jgi:hypothetical protein